MGRLLWLDPSCDYLLQVYRSHTWLFVDSLVSAGLLSYAQEAPGDSLCLLRLLMGIYVMYSRFLGLSLSHSALTAAAVLPLGGWEAHPGSSNSCSCSVSPLQSAGVWAGSPVLLLAGSVTLGKPSPFWASVSSSVEELVLISK